MASEADHTTIPDFPYTGTDKWCAHCQCYHPRISDFWARDKNRGDGLHTQCKITGAEYRAAHRENYAEYYAAYYIANRERIAEYHSEYNPKYRVAHREQRAEYFAANREHIARQQAAYYIANRERITARAAEYRAVNRERTAERQAKWCSANRDHIAKYHAKYHAAHYERRTIHWANRQARKRALPNTLTIAQWRRALLYFDERCVYCGEPLGLGQKMAHEHYIPLVLGGGTTAMNIVPACHSMAGSLLPGCNNRKSDSEPIAWITRTFGTRKAKQIIARIEAYFAWVKEQDGNNVNR